MGSLGTSTGAKVAADHAAKETTKVTHHDISKHMSHVIELIPLFPFFSRWVGRELVVVDREWREYQAELEAELDKL